jgi:hypothetical protein
MEHTRKSRRRGSGPRRPRCFRPHVETLEERLPPGDTLLGALVTQRLLQPHPAGATTPQPASAAQQFVQGANGLRPSPAAATAGSRLVETATSNRRDTRGTTQTASSVQPFEGIPLGTDIAWEWAEDPLQGPFAPRKTGRRVPHMAGAAVTNLEGVLAQAEGTATPTWRTANPPAAGVATAPQAGVGSEALGRPPLLAASSAAALDALPIAANAGGQSPPPRGAVHALFHLDVKTEAPFPTNWFTVPDPIQLTGEHVNLPLPDCQVYVSDCEDLAVINELDGFNMQPRLSIPFDGPIDVHSVNSQDVFLINLGDTVGHHDGGGDVVGINQVVWDTYTDTLHVESDQLLDQHTRYALIVTNGIHDTTGNPVEASDAFRRFRHDVRGEYRHELLDVIHAARRIGVRESDIVTASVFTTESATAVLEKIRDQIHAATPEPADFNLGPDGSRTVFNFEDVTGITWRQQTGDDMFNNVNVSLSVLRDIYPGAVAELAFGKYLSPDYEVHPDQYIPPVATRTGTPVVQGENEIYFNLVLPSGPRPAHGWPVTIYGAAANGNKNAQMPTMAGSLAQHGIATILINDVGQGFGPLGTLTVNQTVGGPVTFPAGGRAIDQDGDRIIDDLEGLFAAEPRTIINDRDGQRQTVADLMQLVRVIQVGVDVHGDGVPDLDPSRIYYWGGSLSSFIGIQFLAVEPDVLAGLPIVTGGPFVEAERLSPLDRPSIGRSLATRVPPLRNLPGVTMIGGVAVDPPYFNENQPLRDENPLLVRLEDGTEQEIRLPVINTVAGAMAIQEVIDNREWVTLSGDSLGYVSHLRKDPLPGVPAKSVLLLFATGDQNVPNPTSSALLRAGDLADRATLYRHDLAYAEEPRMPKNPHSFLGGINNPDIRLWYDIALGAREQAATFFESDGTEIIHPEPVRFFEVPIKGPLPEDLNYIP